MKIKRLAAIFAVVFVIALLCGFDSGRDFGIDAGDGYISCYSDGQLENVVERLNVIYNTSGGEKKAAYDNKKLAAFFADNDIEFFAVSKSDASQIRVAVYSDEISNNMQDLSSKSNDIVDGFAKDLVSGSELKYEIYEKLEGKKFIKIESREEDAGGSYYATQFITVCNGKVFNISFFTDSGLTGEQTAILKTFEVENKSDPSQTPVIMMIVVAVAIALLVCLVIYMGFGILRYFKKPKNAENDINDTNKDEEKEE